jgi:hypothetical protein
MNFKGIIEPGRSNIVGLTAPHRKGASVSFHHLCMGIAHQAQHLGARPFREFEIVGVVDHATDIGVFIIDPDWIYVNISCHPSLRREPIGIA